MTAYNYPFSEFTSLSGDLGRRVLAADVAASIPGVALRPGRRGARFIDDTGQADPRVQFNFDGTLSGSEKTTLDGIVAAHTGQAPREPLAGTTLSWIYRWNMNSGSKRYLSWYDTNESGIITDDRIRMFLPGSYRLVEFVAWSVSGSPGSTKFGVHINNDGAASAIATRVMSASTTPYHFPFNYDVPFGVPIAVSCDPSSSTSNEMVAVSTWLRIPYP